MSDACLSVLVLTEDRARTAHDACAAAARHALQIVDPTTATQRITWVPASEDARASVVANRWKSRDATDQRARTRLVRTIATKLLEQTPGFVLFHFDGDVPWSDRPSPHAASFSTLIVQPVRTLVEGAGASDPDRVLRRLHTMVPHYSIEAWAYQHHERLHDLVVGLDEQLLLASWKLDRASLDELPAPKEALAIRDACNAELLGAGWPRDAVFDADASFAAFCTSLLEDDDLTVALRSTWDESAQ